MPDTDKFPHTIKMMVTYLKYFNSFIASLCSIVLLQSTFIPYLQAQEAGGNNLAVAKRRLGEGLVAAQGFGLSLDSINNIIIPEAEELSGRLRAAGDSDADMIDQKIITPVRAANSVLNTLNECDLNSVREQISETLVSGIQAESCKLEDIKLSHGLTELIANLDAVTGYIPQREEEQLIADFYRDVLNQTRENTISMYYNVASKFSTQMPSDPVKAINRIYQIGGMQAPDSVLADQNLKNTLQNLAEAQPIIEAERIENRINLFEGFRNNLLEIRDDLGDSYQTRVQHDRQLSLNNGDWINYDPRTQIRGNEIDFRDRFLDGRGNSLFNLNNSGMFNPYRNSYGFDNSTLTLSPALSIVTPAISNRSRQLVLPGERESYEQLRDYRISNRPLSARENAPAGLAIPRVLEERYGVQIRERDNSVGNFIQNGISPQDALAQELESIYPGQGTMLAETYIQRLDSEFRVIPEGEERRANPILISPDRIISINRSTLSELSVIDLNGSQTSFERGNSDARHELHLSIERNRGKARNNFLSWQGNGTINSAISHGLSDENRLTDEALSSTMKDFFKNSLELLAKIENELADKDPRQGLKDAIAQNPGVIAQVLAKNPKYAGIACKLSKELLEDRKDEASSDTFWAVAGLIVFVGAVLLTGGLALAGVGAAYGLLITAGVGIAVGVGEVAHNVGRSNQLKDEARNLELYFQTQGVGDPARIKELRERASEHMTTAIITGALLPLEALAIFRGIKLLKGRKALQALERAARSGGDVVSLAKQFGKTRYANDISQLVRRVDRRHLKAAEKALSETLDGKKLTGAQRSQIYLAHIVGNGEVGADGINIAARGNYTAAHIASKARILEAFTPAQRRILMDQGFVGLEPAPSALSSFRGNIFSVRSKSGNSYGGEFLRQDADRLYFIDADGLEQALYRSRIVEESISFRGAAASLQEGQAFSVRSLSGNTYSGEFVRETDEAIFFRQAGNTEVSSLRKTHLNLNTVGRNSYQAPTSTADDLYLMREANGELIGNYRTNGYESKQFFDNALTQNRGRNLSYDEFNRLNDNMHRVASVGENGATPYATKSYNTGNISAGQRLDVQGTYDSAAKLSSGRPKMDLYTNEILTNHVRVPRNTSATVNVKGVLESARPANLQGRHWYPPVGELQQYYRSGHTQLNSIRNLPAPRNSAETQEVMNQVADYYHTMVNARPYQQINNSMYMNQVNSLLQSKGLPRMTHGHLDHLAHRTDFEDFRAIFKLHGEGKIPAPSSLGF